MTHVRLQHQILSIDGSFSRPVCSARAFAVKVQKIKQGNSSQQELLGANISVHRSDFISLQNASLSLNSSWDDTGYLQKCDLVTPLLWYFLPLCCDTLETPLIQTPPVFFFLSSDRQVSDQEVHWRLWSKHRWVDDISRAEPLYSSLHSFTCLSLSVSVGALYSRKVTLDGEEVSLQIQDTPCVALQVTRGKVPTAGVFPSQSFKGCMK